MVDILRPHTRLAPFFEKKSWTLAIVLRTTQWPSLWWFLDYYSREKWSQGFHDAHSFQRGLSGLFLYPTMVRNSLTLIIPFPTGSGVIKRASKWTNTAERSCAEKNRVNSANEWAKRQASDPVKRNDLKGPKFSIRYWRISVTVGSGIAGFNCSIFQSRKFALYLSKFILEWISPTRRYGKWTNRDRQKDRQLHRQIDRQIHKQRMENRYFSRTM